MRFGIHAGPQDCSIDELRRLWRLADEHGFHWCSVWDHLYSTSDASAYHTGDTLVVDGGYSMF